MEKIKAEIGSEFELAGSKWKIIDVTDKGAICFSETIGDRTLSDNTNNWQKSELREYLNGEYLKKIEEEIGAENILPFERNLLSLDGQDEYGTCEDKVSLLTVDDYRKYRKFIPNSNYWFWLCSPWSTECNGYKYSVTVVSPSGDFFGFSCDGGLGCRPFCIFSSSIFES